MSKRSTVPAYRRHKASNRAYVFMNGRRIYLGRFGSEESKAEYRRILNELDSSPTRGVASSMPLRPTSDLTIAELGLAYVDQTDAYYRKPNGEPTTEAALVERVVDMVVDLYGHTLVNEFGPLALKAVRAAMIEKGWRRLTINGNIGRVVRMFKWAAENELVGGNALHALRSVSGLRYGRSSGPESSPVLPVSAKTIEATLPHLSPQVRAMVEFQRLTAMRPGEVCQMRPSGLNRSGEVWTFTPTSHKTQHHGRERRIPIGPRAQAILKPFLVGRDENAPLFSPAEAMIVIRTARNAARRTPFNQGNKPGSNRLVFPKKSPGQAFSTASYGRCIRSACERIWPTKNSKKRKVALTPDVIAANRTRHWHPNQLRHTAATELRKAFGLEAAQVILGHAKADVTQVYAERDAAKAYEVAREVG